MSPFTTFFVVSTSVTFAFPSLFSYVDPVSLPFVLFFPAEDSFRLALVFLSEDCFSCAISTMTLLSHSYMPAVTISPRIHRYLSAVLTLYGYSRQRQIGNTCTIMISTWFSRFLDGRRWLCSGLLTVLLACLNI